ncbi:hypothetical protein GGI20_001372 [Coemansia sp. BCRC 34301]|nr:hypothetical protein GGI20_001372 [Coemansia sp. BCRC 34301]
MSEVKSFTASQIQPHSTREDIWIVVHGKVYDVTPFLDEHPGGEEVMLEYAGADATEAFEDIGHSDDARDLLSKFFIGNLEVEFPGESRRPAYHTPKWPTAISRNATNREGKLILAGLHIPAQQTSTELTLPL